MASPVWQGGTTAVAQENRFTPGGTIEADDVFIITLTNEAGSTLAISAVAGGTTVAAVTAALLTAWNTAAALAVNSAFNMSGITASDQTTYFKLLGTAGVPFYAAATTTENGGGAADAQTFTKTATTACAGPLDWNTAGNWSTGAVPVSTDSVTIDGRGASYAITYGLVQSSVTLASLKHYRSMTANVGTTSSALKISATIAQLNLDPNDGSSTTPGLVNVQFGTNATTCENFGGGNASVGLAPVIVGGTHASNIFRNYGGVVDLVGLTPAETGTWATVDVRGGTVEIGSGASLTTWTNNGGSVIVNCAYTTGTNTTGTATLNGSGTLTTTNADGGTIRHNNRGTNTTLNLNGGTVDFTGNAAAVTIGTLAILKGGTIRVFSSSQATFSARTITQTNGVNFNLVIG